MASQDWFQKDFYKTLGVAKDVSEAELKEIIARWFFMVSLTSRYSGSFETTFEQDLVRISETQDKTAAAFVKHLSVQIENTFTNDYWSITLPGEFDTSASRSPALFAYVAALNILDADALLSSNSVRGWLDPAVLSVKGIERHHLFPKQFLASKLHLNNPRQINQIANYALVEWSDNIAISDEAPLDYWPSELAKKPAVLDSGRLQKQLYWHAIPDAWPNIDYETFLIERRKLIAKVVRDAYSKLLDSAYEPNYSDPANPTSESDASSNAHLGVSLKDLIGEGALTPGVILTPRSEGYDSAAEVTVEGQILLNDQLFDTPSAAAAAIGARVNGFSASLFR